jgi:hypothetical protein
MDGLWRWFKARFRLDLNLVCEMSKGKGMADYHDYPDTLEGEPWHFAVLVCKRCGKEFMI